MGSERKMGNKKRGEVSIFMGEGEDRRDYTLRFSLNSLCILEESVGRGFMEMATSWEKGELRISEVREVVRAAIKGGDKMTSEEIGDLIEEYGIYEMIDNEGKVIGTEIDAYHMRWTWRWEMEYLLRQCGFRVESLYGNYHRIPYPGASNELIFICTVEDKPSAP